MRRLTAAKRLWREIAAMDPSYPSEDEPMKRAKQKLQQHGEAG
jgi:hypothetical protein